MPRIVLTRVVKVALVFLTLSYKLSAIHFADGLVTNFKGGYVKAKFLYYNGAPVFDPNYSEATKTPIYDSNYHPLATQNTNGYRIVPSNYTVQTAISFAKSVSHLDVFGLIPGSPLGLPRNTYKKWIASLRSQ